MNQYYRFSIVILTILCMVPGITMKISGQNRAVNYDESAIPAYTLPDPLKFDNGRPVISVESWLNERKPEIMSLFESQVYGRTPVSKLMARYTILRVDTMALNGMAIRKEIRIDFISKANAPSLTMLMFLPKSQLPVPLFLGLNFYGNHTIINDTAILISPSWEAANHKRGEDSLSWPVREIIRQGFGLATIYYGDIDPDADNGFKNGIQPVFYSAGQTRPAPDEWGSIGGWAWGLSRAMDYLENDICVDSKKVVVIGHSRLGKTALWAGAQDQRFAIVISNNSGCGGAALSKRIYGETVQTINTAFPHWFCGNFKKYNDLESALPVDQHMLIALIAPRPVYIASAQEDRWADPKGEFLGALYADPVYKLFGMEGLPVAEMPPLNSPLMGTIGYHIRTGGHAITRYDWSCYLQFAEKHFAAVQANKSGN
jgi:hypothetical protein